MSTAVFNTWQNSDGTVNYKCRAWVNFNGTTTPPTIRASGNVSSVTKNGTGDYTVNFTTAMPDANYAAPAATSVLIAIRNWTYTVHTSTKLTTSCRVHTGFPNTNPADCEVIDIAFFR
jgi:hypothetical protein